MKNFTIILKPLYDLLKAEINSLEIKTPKEKQQQQQKNLQLDSCVQVKFTNNHQNKFK